MPVSPIARKLAAATDATTVDHRAASLAKARAAKRVKRENVDPFRHRQPRLCCGLSVSRQDTFFARGDLRSVGIYPFAKGLPSAAQRAPRRPKSQARFTLSPELAARLAADRGFQGLAGAGNPAAELVSRTPRHGARVQHSAALGRMVTRECVAAARAWIGQPTQLALEVA